MPIVYDTESFAFFNEAAKIENPTFPILEANKVLMIGDSATDIIAGKACGCRTIAITGGYGNKEALLATKPDIVLHYVTELI